MIKVSYEFWFIRAEELVSEVQTIHVDQVDELKDWARTNPAVWALRVAEEVYLTEAGMRALKDYGTWGIGSDSGSWVREAGEAICHPLVDMVTGTL